MQHALHTNKWSCGGIRAGFILAVSLAVSACGDGGNDHYNGDQFSGINDDFIVASDSVSLTPKTVNGVAGRPNISAASSISVSKAEANNTFDFSITGPQRASGGHQGWTDSSWARVTYRGQLGLYRVTVDTSNWRAGESSRVFQLVANNDAGQTVLPITVIVAGGSPVSPPPTPNPTPSPTSTPVATPTPAPPVATPASKTEGVNGKPTVTVQTRIPVRRNSANNVTGFSVSGPARSRGGFQSWTNRSWAKVSYAGSHGQYRIAIDTNGWSANESQRTFILTANNDAGQTTLRVDAYVADGPATPQTPVVTPPAPQLEPQVEPPVLAGSGNSVDTIINDMGLPNDGRLDGIPDFFWATNKLPAQIAMGADSRGCYAPQWWQNTGSVRAAYKDCEYWTAYIQWFVIFEGVGNAANNVRVETRRPQTWYLSKTTGRWKLLGQAAGTSWFLATKSDLVYSSGAVGVANRPDGATSLRVDRASPYAYHGVWPQGVIDIAGIASDIRALFTTVEARLAVNNPAQPDDRDRALWMLQSGADYYPAVGVPVQDAVPPGAGLSRSKRITSQWQSFNFATISNARIDYRGPNKPLTPAELRGNPPPLK